MRVYVELSDKDTFEKLCSAISLSGGVVVARQIDADLFVGEKIHSFLGTVLIANEVPEDLTGVIDVLLPSRSLEYYLLKFRMIFYSLAYGVSLEDFLNEEIYKSHRYNVPLSVLMARLVNFDVHFLERIYNVFKTQARESDKLFVHDSSIIGVLPYTDLEGAKVFAKRVLRRSRTINYSGKTPELVISVAQVSRDDEAFDLLGKLEFIIERAIQTGQRIVLA